MKKKTLSVLFTAAFLALAASACGADDTPPSGQETPEAPAVDENAPSGSESTEENASAEEETDTGVIEEDAAKAEESAAPGTTSDTISVTFRESLDELKGDDGTVILTSSTQMPVVSIEGAADIAEKINADLEEYYKTFSTSNNETAEMAREDYAASLGEDGWDFLGYSTDISAEVTRMDEDIISFRITLYDFTGGAHGNYGSTGRNYSVKTGALLALDEISEDYEAFHAAVLDYMINLADTPAYKDKLFGPPAKADLDSTLFDGDGWVFTRSGISFLVPPYSLGPYASGEISFRLPYEKAYELGLKEDFRYDGNFVDKRYYIYKYDPETFEPVVDGDPDFYFDLNGDGTEEGLALYGQVVDPATGESGYAFYIDGKDFGEVIGGQIGDAAKNGYMDNSYALYDSDPADGLTEIAVLFTQFAESSSESGSTDSLPYTYLFRYTPEKELQFLEKRDGFVTLPTQP